MEIRPRFSRGAREIRAKLPVISDTILREGVGEGVGGQGQLADFIRAAADRSAATDRPAAMALVRSRIWVTGRVTDRVISTDARMLNATPATAEQSDPPPARVVRRQTAGSCALGLSIEQGSEPIQALERAVGRRRARLSATVRRISWWCLAANNR